MARNRFNRKADEAVIDAVAAVAANRGVGPAEDRGRLASGPTGRQLHPSWGPPRSSHLDDAVKALGTHLTREESEKLEGAYETQPPLPLYIRPVPTAAEAAGLKS